MNNLHESLINKEELSLAAIQHHKKQSAMAQGHFEKSYNNFIVFNSNNLDQIKFYQSKMEIIEHSGGVCGAFELEGNNLFLPILIGYHVPDIDTEDITMPVLDVQIKDDNSLYPVFGSMTNPVTGEKEAIELGKLCVDIATAEEGKVIGARNNKATNVVNATLQIGKLFDSGHILLIFQKCSK